MDEGKTDEEIRELIRDYYIQILPMLRQGNFAASFLPPLKEGEQRKAPTRTLSLDDDTDRLLDTNTLLYRLDMQGRWVMDVVAKEEEQ